MQQPNVSTLGEHLVAMYAHGDVGLETGPLADWFARANGQQRETVLSDVGRGLRPPSDDQSAPRDERVPPEVLARLQQLWNIRINAPGHKEEASAFAWWFASGLFEDRWAMEHLASAARTRGRMDALHFASERLSRLADRFPGEGVELLSALLQTQERDMWSYSLRDALRPILEAAKRAGGSAWEAARYVINRMGERGLGDYGDLLRN